MVILLALSIGFTVFMAIAHAQTSGFLIGDTPFRFVGGFLPGWHWGQEFWSEAADDDLIGTARSTGITVMHLMLPLFENGLGNYEETALLKLDHFLDSAYRANVYVMPSFIQAYSGTRIPGDTYYPYYHDRSIEGIIKDPALRQAFKNRIAALVNRQNTVNGRFYKEDPVILAWVLCDEPVSAPFNYGPGGFPQVTLDEMIDWFRESALFIKSMDPNHLVTVSTQPAIQEFFGGTPETQYDYLKAVGIPEFDFLYTEDPDLRIISGLTQFCTLTPDYDLEQFRPRKPVVFMPSFTSGCWDRDAICFDYDLQAADLTQAGQRFFEVGASGVLIQIWGTDLYPFVPSFDRCFVYTDSNQQVATAIHSLSVSINPDAAPSGPLQFVSVDLTASIVFLDVPSGYWAENYITAIYKPGITTGCTQDDPTTIENERRYCLINQVTREQMAAFIVRAKEGEPPADYCLGGSPFGDVPADNVFCRYIKRLSELNVTQGCTPGMYCPSDNVTREQMAAFLVRAKVGEPALNYCDTGAPFIDVPTSSIFCRYVKKLLELNITQGCAAGMYCPSDNVLRDQMAAFLTRAFLGAP